MMIELLKPDFEHRDDRGVLMQLFSGQIGQVNYVESEKDAVRGNFHYHEFNDESFFVISGEVQVFLEQNGEEESHTFRAGSLFRIRRGIGHKFVYLQKTELIVIYDNGVVLSDGRKDIVNN